MDSRNALTTLHTYPRGRPSRAELPAPFRPGWFARDPGRTLRLALSETHTRQSESVRAAVAAEIDRLHLYPDSDTEPLRSAVARRWRVDPEQVVVTNGADEALLLTTLAVTLPGDRAVFTERTFAGYAADFAIGSLHPETTRVDTGGIDVASFIEALSGARIALLCNPHNPTGACLPGEVIADIAGRAASCGTTLVIDEAYAEFADPGVFQPAWGVTTGRGVVVLRSFSKAYGLAGLRCGYALAEPQVAEQISALRAALPYNVNRLALAGAATAPASL